MGTVSSLFDRIFNRGGSDARILMIGLDGAGRDSLCILMDSSFLAHLSRRLMGELIVYQSLRRPSVRRSTVLNIFSSETTGSIKLKFHMETS